MNGSRKDQFLKQVREAADALTQGLPYRPPYEQGKSMNGGILCDAPDGPCACGAYHHYEEWDNGVQLARDEAKMWVDENKRLCRAIAEFVGHAEDEFCRVPLKDALATFRQAVKEALV